MITWYPGMTLESLEQQVIVAAYRHNHKNKTQTAKALGIAIRTLDNKLEQYDKEQQETQDVAETMRVDRKTKERKEHEASDRHAYPESYAPNKIVNNNLHYKTVAELISESKAKAEALGAIDKQPKQGELDVQPVSEASEERAMSMREPKEVQEVSSAKAAVNHPNAGRDRKAGSDGSRREG